MQFSGIDHHRYCSTKSSLCSVISYAETIKRRGKIALHKHFNSLLQQLGTSSTNTTYQQLVNRLVTTCLQICDNLCVFTRVPYLTISYPTIFPQFSTSLSQTSPGSQVQSQASVPQPKTSRSLSMSSSYSGETPLVGSYPRAPGSERSESRSSSRDPDDWVSVMGTTR